MESNYYLIEKAIHYIESNAASNPSLEEIAFAVGLSPFHFQRLFKEWAGITPKRFVQVLKIEHIKKVLIDSKSIFEASIDSNLSSSSRLYDLFFNIEAISPKEFKTRGKDLEITYGFHTTLFGECIVAITKNGICGLRFIENGTNHNLSLQQLKHEWPNATFIHDDLKTQKYIDLIFSKKKPKEKINLYLKGTNFQIQVWRALLSIPMGNLVAYEDIAKFINSPKAVRAVGTAVGKNPISFLIPCHRVINKIGVISSRGGQAYGLGNYRWGRQRKKAMLGIEL